jgi:[citrate (pro-3S)-lyase] ligase
VLEGRPLKGYDLERLKEFLKSMDLDYDMGIEYSICLEDEDYRIIAAGSVEENVLKCIPGSSGRRTFRHDYFPPDPV